MPSERDIDDPVETTLRNWFLTPEERGNPWTRIDTRRLLTVSDTLEFLEAGECPHVTVEDTLGQMRTLDRLRESAGLHFR